MSGRRPRRERGDCEPSRACVICETRQRVYTPKQRLSSPVPNHRPSRVVPPSIRPLTRPHDASMKVTIKKWHAIAQWRWDTGHNDPDDDGEGDVCGICRVPFEGCCPTCKMPGEDCPLSSRPRSLLLRVDALLTESPCHLVWGECTHVFHMHCLLQWIGTSSSTQQCPMDRRPWGECLECFA